MAIGERIRFFRNLRGMTQKQLGMAVGFPERTADVRMAQYETGSRTPKAKLTRGLAYILDISPDALNIPDVRDSMVLMHTLFALEDLRGLRIGERDGEIYLYLDMPTGMPYDNLTYLLKTWYQQPEKLKSGEITKEDYDKWRYHYSKFDTSHHWARVPSKEPSDALIKAFRKKPKK